MEATNKTILVADDKESMRRNIRDLLEPIGYNVHQAENGEAAIRIFSNIEPDLVILDINMPDMNGLDVLERLKVRNKGVPIIVFTAFGTSERAIRAMKSGAFDYIEKPFEMDEFVLSVERALQYGSLLKEVTRLRSMVDEQSEPALDDYIIGNSPNMQEIYKLIGRVAPSDATVLIQGQSGTGKELVADAIHRHSHLSDKPYLKINCGALSESLLESEIFGHEKGSFTGAFAQRKGLFEMANGGTLYLDEINSMPQSLQVKLLRVLQKQPFFRVGGDRPVSVDVRIIASCNKDIRAEVEQGNFREDLYYRLNVVFIHVPPLRERISDIEVLARHFLQKYGAGKMITIPSGTLAKLKKYAWPGNVRELENTIHSALVTSSGEILEIDQIPVSPGQGKSGANYMELIEQGMSMKDVIEVVEKKIINEALARFGYNQSKTADYLKINRRLLYTRLKDWTP